MYDTILKVLFGWEHFEEGQVLVQGINVGKLDVGNMHILRRSIGVIFQDYKLLTNKTVFKNVAFAQEVTNRDRKTIKFKTWEALKNELREMDSTFDIDNVNTDQINTLQQKWQQELEIAQTFNQDSLGKNALTGINTIKNSVLGKKGKELE